MVTSSDVGTVMICPGEYEWVNSFGHLGPTEHAIVTLQSCRSMILIHTLMGLVQTSDNLTKPIYQSNCMMHPLVDG